MSRVVIKECSSYDIDMLMEKINNGMEQLGGWEAFLKPEMTVLLKVNLIGPKTPDSGAVTHCEFIRALARILKGKGCKVWVGDSSGGAIAGLAPTQKSFAVSGIASMAAEEGIELKNFDREGVVEVSREGSFLGRLFIAKPMFEADLVINLPKLKTHSAGIYTGAVKNLFGCIPGLRKAEYHKAAPDVRDLGKIMADINQSVKVGLHIMDGIIAMQGEGPTAGRPYQAGKLLLSTDPLALDIKAMGMLGLKLEEVPILEAAVERKLGAYRTEDIELVGDYEELPVLNGFRMPKRLGSVKASNRNMIVKVVNLLKARPTVNHKLCRSCNVCVDSCPVNAIDKGSKKINYKSCIECMCCHELCMYKAIDLRHENRLVGLLMKLFAGSYR